MITPLLKHCAAILSGLAAFLPVAGNAQTGDTDVMVYYGEAYALDEPTTLIYREEHRLQLRDGKPYQRDVNYFDAEGKMIAQKENRYFNNAAAPDFRLQDLRNNYREQALYNDDGSLTLGLQESDGQAWQEKRIKSLPDDLIIDAGFDEFVRRHWQTLLAGKQVTFSFASAARQDLVNFRLQTQSADEHRLVLSMRLQSRMLSWLLSPIELTYDRQSQRLLRYRGLSNILDEQGNSYQADIRYQYPAAVVGTSTASRD
ncbi:MAG: hypothetical protein LRY66_15315 [Saccharospirillaceae bacterium]|nr:hypothetical protein [Saccharospirillaceae bacterium]MCD8532674.1 hypothetical protein [Saccharospirillaceae bacterium]